MGLYDNDGPVELLKELFAVVKGECPSLLEEDSDGNGDLCIAIKDCIAAWNRRADGWQPIETAPRDGTGIIYFQRVDEKLWWIGTATYADGHFRATDFFSKDDDPLIAPTHWMPLPEPPESEVKP